MREIGYVFGNKQGWYAHSASGRVYMAVGFGNGLIICRTKEEAKRELEQIKELYEDAKLIKIGEIK